MACGSFNTRTGAALIEIGEGANQVVLTDTRQLNDASLRIERDQFEHKTQASSRPNKYIITGLEGKLELSIADVDLNSIKTVFFGSNIEKSVTTYTRADSTTIDVEREKLVIKDFAGTELEGQKVVIKPYPLIESPAEKDAAYSFGGGGLTYAGTDYATAGEAEDAFLADANAYQDWVNSWVTFPCGALTDINGTNLAYGLQTQQELKLTITSLPEDDGTRMIFGDTSVA